MIYLASPYTHDDPAVRESRFEAACIATAKYMRRGLFVFSPILHSHPLVRFGLPLDWNYWEPMDRFFLQHCKEVYVLKLDGWQESRGVQAEIQLARQFYKRVSFIEAAIVYDEKTSVDPGA